MKEIISKINSLNNRREKIQEMLSHSSPMIKGSLYEMKRSCGKPNCRCQRGELHSGIYLSTKVGGRTKIQYIRKNDRPWVMGLLIDHRSYQKKMAEIRTINNEISGLFKQLKDLKIITYK